MAVEWVEWPGYKACSWNPIHGCDPISEACERCWAKTTAERRLRGKAGYDKDQPFKVTLRHERLKEPKSWKKPHACFVVDMGDLFHKDVPDDFITWVFDTLASTPQHLYFVLTKRARRMADYLDERYTIFERLNHVWFGVTAENQKRAEERIPELLRLPTGNRFVSLEPLLGPINMEPYLPYHGIHSEPTVAWVITGGESGQGCRPMDLAWVTPIRDQCAKARVAFYYKQKGGFPDPKHREKALLDGKLYKEFPVMR